MQPSKALKYILDMESVIEEIEFVKHSVGNDFKRFKNDMLAYRAVERQLQIIGEAITILERSTR